MEDELEGQVAPSVMLLPCSTGGKINIPKDLKGSWTILYFYPKDDTPGCTVEACSFRDSIEDFKNRKIKVYGVSSDPIPSHNNFIAKYQLNFPLIADLHNILSRQLGAYVDNKISRDVILIDPDGKIVKIWRKVHPEKTVQNIKNFLVTVDL